MRGPIRHCLALFLLLSLTPGVGEVLENVGHLVVRGHTAHAEAQDDEHSEPGREHGCTGAFHLCSCHLTPSFDVPAAAAFSRSGDTDGRLVLASELSTRAGFHDIPERPPRV